jgi:hypothetical protein
VSWRILVLALKKFQFASVKYINVHFTTKLKSDFAAKNLAENKKKF